MPEDEPFGARFVSEMRRRCGVTMWPFALVMTLQGADRSGVIAALEGHGASIPIEALHALRNSSPEAAAARWAEHLAHLQADPIDSFNTLGLYFCGALGSSFASLLVHSGVVSGGASGAVFAVYGALLAYAARRQGLLPNLGRLPGRWPRGGLPDVPSGLLERLGKTALWFIGMNALIALATPGVDNAAHIGGALTGFVCGLLGWKPFNPPDANPHNN